MDIADLLKDKRGVLKYILQTIESSTKNAKGLLSMKERGFSDAGMLDEPFAGVDPIAVEDIQALAMIALVSLQNSDFDKQVGEMMNKMGRGDEALQIMLDKKLRGE